MSNSVMLKSYNGAIKLILDPDMNFNELLGCIRDKFYASRNFLGKGSIILDISGRLLSDIEESLVIDAITASSDVEISLVIGKDEEEAERIRKVGGILEDRMKEDDTCRVFHGSLMNNKHVEVEDSVIVFGDVNPGSKIVSRGNIIVLGGLYGTAHAGCNGDSASFICAIEMEPEKLLISELEYKPDTKPIWSAVLKSAPKVARILDKEITIGPLNRVVMEKIYEYKKLQT